MTKSYKKPYLKRSRYKMKSKMGNANVLVGSNKRMAGLNSQTNKLSVAEMIAGLLPFMKIGKGRR